MMTKKSFLEKIYHYEEFKMYDEEYLIGLVNMIRDYLVNEEISKEDIIEYVSNYELKG